MTYIACIFFVAYFIYALWDELRHAKWEREAEHDWNRLQDDLEQFKEEHNDKT